MRGWFTSNPGEVRAFMCFRCRKRVKPRLVSVHHTRPELRLYGCEGCKQYLILISLSKCCEPPRSKLHAHAHMRAPITHGLTVQASLTPRR